MTTQRIADAISAREGWHGIELNRLWVLAIHEDDTTVALRVPSAESRAVVALIESGLPLEPALAGWLVTRDEDLPPDRLKQVRRLLGLQRKTSTPALTIKPGSRP